MIATRSLSTESLLIVVTVLLSVAWASNALHLSAFWGRLAFPPYSDDVGYLLSGFHLFETTQRGDLVSQLKPVLRHHAPMQSLLAFAGYRLFGVNKWSAYQMNGILLVVFMLAILWMTRSLGAVSRLSIVVIVLAMPLTTNLVAEFRPDLLWGLLCGLAVFMVLRPPLFDPAWKVRTGAVILGVAALHAKPSAAPATALLLAAALATAIGLRLIYRPLSAGEFAIRLGMPLAVGLVVSAPFFISNWRHLYDYMYLALVTFRDVNQFRGSALEHATYYSAGLCYRAALFTMLWVGIVALVANAVRLRICRRNQDLAYHLGLVAVVVMAYLIPTLSGVKSYFLGGIFYGTFVVATVGTLVATVDALQGYHNTLGRLVRCALPVAAGLSILMAPAVPLVNVADRRFAADINAVYAQMMSTIGRDASSFSPVPGPSGMPAAPSSPPRPVVVYVPSPAVLDSVAISLLARWEGMPIVGTEGYYTRTLAEHQRNLAQSDYAILSEFHDSVYPGSLLSPRVLEFVTNHPDFERISTFRHANGLRTFLFRHKRADAHPRG
jgi:hypothetical protein